MVYARLLKEKRKVYQEKLKKVMDELPATLKSAKEAKVICARIDALEEKHGLDRARIEYQNILRKFVYIREKEELAIKLSHMSMEELEELAKPHLAILEKLGA